MDFGYVVFLFLVGAMSLVVYSFVREAQKRRNRTEVIKRSLQITSGWEDSIAFEPVRGSSRRR